MSRRRSKYIVLLILVTCVMLFFTGVYQMFVYDGKAKYCYSEIWKKYHETKSHDWIQKKDKEDCSQPWNYFKYWKYVTFSSVVLFFGSGIYLIRKRKRKE